MTTTIDSTGRVLLPKAVRDAAGLRPGVPVAVRYRDGRVEIEPAPVEVEVEDVDGVAVARATRPVPPLPAHVVDAVQARLRGDDD